MMDPILRAVLSSWGWRLDVILILLVFGSLFTIGWLRLRSRTRDAWKTRRRNKHNALAAPWRLVSYLSGLVMIGIALMSPIDIMSQQLFFMHMIQHLFLIMIAPPLLLITNPMPYLLWGLPASWRLKVGYGIGRLLHKDHSLRSWIRTATGAGVVWLFWVSSVIIWHDPQFYNAALRSEFIHDLEHLSFFIAGMLFWWLATGAGPRIHKRFGFVGRIAFVLGAVPPNMALGIILAFSNVVIYSYYEAVPRLWGIDPVTDQSIGGIIMWIPGSMMFIIAALILTAQYLQREVEKPALPISIWSKDETMAAPGLKR